MTLALVAQKKIDSLPFFTKPSNEELQSVEHLKVDYKSVLEMPKYKRDKLHRCIDFILEKFGTGNPIYLVRSQLDGYPVDERTSFSDFKKLKRLGLSTKFSDWDFVCSSMQEGFSYTETIAPLIKIDVFNFHHGKCRKLVVWE